VQVRLRIEVENPYALISASHQRRWNSAQLRHVFECTLSVATIQAKPVRTGDGKIRIEVVVEVERRDRICSGRDAVGLAGERQSSGVGKDKRRALHRVGDG